MKFIKSLWNDILEYMFKDRTTNIFVVVSFIVWIMSIQFIHSKIGEYIVIVAFFIGMLIYIISTYFKNIIRKSK